MNTKQLIVLILAAVILVISILADVAFPSADTQYIHSIGYMASGSLFTTVAHIVGGKNGKITNITDAGKPPT